MSTHGQFCWFELMTPDPDAAEAFYTGLFGWTAADAGTPGIDYRLFSRDGGNVAGMMAQFEGGPPPSWIGYVSVDDVDAVAEAAGRTGATLHRPPTDIPGIGRFAILADPQGAVLAMLQPLPTDAPWDMQLDTPGRIGWHELITSDLDAAWRFYEPLFRWRKGEGHDMGPLGTYQLFGPEGLDRDFGGMATMQMRPSWGYYVNVEELDAAMARVRDGGGVVRQGPHQVPGGNWIAQCADPQGVAFSLVSPER